MEFYINHSWHEIARVPAEQWEEEDDIERVIVHMDDEDEFRMMVELIDRYKYDINKDDYELFMHDIELERTLAKQYDEMVKQEDDGKSIDSWQGWDEMGASFDY